MGGKEGYGRVTVPSMLPAAFTLQNYRSYGGPQRIELRPITLLYGVNNAGKSSLLRALPLIGDSVEPDVSGPLDLECSAMNGASFEDIRWSGAETRDGDGEYRDNANQGIRLSLHWDDDALRTIDYVFDRVESPTNPLLRRLRIRTFSTDGADGWTYAARQLRRAEEAASALTYEIQHEGDAPRGTANIDFEGLLPRVPAGDAESGWLGGARSRLAELRGQIQWLRAKRQAPLRYSILPSSPRYRLKVDGSDAAQLLAAQPDLLSAVSSWYERMTERRLVLPESPPAAFRTQLQHIRTGSTTDVLDSGEGMNQVLSVLCALELARSKHPRAPRILALEEPESHLHPQLQRGLVERIVDVVSQADSPRVVLETHSEHILLGVQLAIVRGQLRPEDVAVYWVRQEDDGRSVAELSTFDELAFPQGAWPAGVFTEDTELAREIVRARRARTK